MLNKDFGKPWYDTYISYLHNPAIDALETAKTEINPEKALEFANAAKEKLELLLNKNLYPAASSYAETWKKVVAKNLLEADTLIEKIKTALHSCVA